MSGAEKLVERLSQAAEAAGDDQRAATFARGLALGALVGAAIAGSSIWQRRHARLTRGAARQGPPEATETDPKTAIPTQP